MTIGALHPSSATAFLALFSSHFFPHFLFALAIVTNDGALPLAADALFFVHTYLLIRYFKTH
jgi:hypothetical protein